jgi:hypothetical protein
VKDGSPRKMGNDEVHGGVVDDGGGLDRRSSVVKVGSSLNCGPVRCLPKGLTVGAAQGR